MEGEGSKVTEQQLKTLQYHIAHIRTLQQAAESALLVADLATARLCLEDSKRHLDEVENSGKGG